MMLTRVMRVSRSAYYAWRHGEPSNRALEDARLLVKIKQIHRDSFGTYGAPRIHAELREEHDVRIGKKRVARLMREADLVGVHRRKHKNPNDARAPESESRAFENLLEGNFTADAPNRRYVADITQHETLEGWLYLAVILDLFGRRVVGWSMGSTMHAELVVDALQMAIANRQPPIGVIHHSDRGSQYTSLTFGRHLEENGMLGSMSKPGSPAENAAMESFFASLETELLVRKEWDTRQELKTAIFHYIEVFYNRQRRHSTLGYVSPAEYERRYNQSQVAA
jgi:transposase InsO family protein